MYCSTASIAFCLALAGSSARFASARACASGLVKPRLLLMKRAQLEHQLGGLRRVEGQEPLQLGDLFDPLGGHAPLHQRQVLVSLMGDLPGASQFL